MPIRKAFLLALFLFVVLTLSWFLFFLKWRESVDRYETQPQEPAETLDSGLRPPSPDGDSRLLAVSPGLDLSELGLLEYATEQNRRALLDLQKELAEMPMEQAIEQILAWLESGSDLNTGLWFQLGPGGRLIEAPSFRTFALEQLALLDPQVAADLAGQNFQLPLPGSADEFALQLRNFARMTDVSDMQAVRLLEMQMQRMVAHEEWIKRPGIGFLEAFDVWVAFESANAVTDLSTWLNLTEQNPALQHAAYLTLERLIDRAPQAVFAALEPWSASSIPATAAKHRAALWARAPIELFRGEQIAQAYLLNPGVTSTERQAYFAQLPNLHYSHSHNLLSEAVVPDACTLLQRLEATQAQLLHWREDARFGADRVAIDQALQRLHGMFGAHAHE